MLAVSSPSRYRDIASGTSGAFSGVFGDKFGIDGLELSTAMPTASMTNYVTGNFFSTLGIKPLARAPLCFWRGRNAERRSSIRPFIRLLAHAILFRPSIIGAKVLLMASPSQLLGSRPTSFHGIAVPS